MLKHVVLMKFKPETGEGAIKKAIDDFFALKEKTGAVKSVEHGLNVSPEGFSQGFTHCFLMNFADESARDRYLAHPAQVEFVNAVLPMLDNGLVVDFEATKAA